MRMTIMNLKKKFYRALKKSTGSFFSDTLIVYELFLKSKFFAYFAIG